MKFEDCNIAYQDSECLLKIGVKGHPVTFDVLADFDQARRKLSRLVKDGTMHESWEDGVKLFNVIHAKIARTPCRPSWLVNEILNAFGRRQLIKQLEERSDSVDKAVGKALQDVIDHLGSLSKIESSPLLEPISRVDFSKGKTCVILRDLRLWDEVQSCLSEVFQDSEWELVKPSSLRNHHHATRLIIFGPAWYLGYKYEEYLLRSPAAGKAYLIACAHEFTGNISLSLLGKPVPIQITGGRKTRSNEDPWNFEPISPAQRGGFKFKGGNSGILETGNKIAAVPFKLGGGRGTYFKSESDVWVVNADCMDANPICSGVEKIPVEDLDTGDLVLMTTSGGGNMIPLVADMILTNSRKIRELQLTWKSALLRQIVDSGLSQVSISLKALGAQKASPTNLLNWCNPRSIGMESLETDLMAVLQLIGMGNRYNEVIFGIEALRRAHQSAGRQLQNKLRESLSGMDLSELFKQGYLEIKDGDGPAKTVFLVEERGLEDEIPEEWEGELRDIDE